MDRLPKFELRFIQVLLVLCLIGTVWNIVALDLMDGEPRLVRTRSTEWICRDGEIVRHSLASEPEELRAVFFARFDADVTEIEKLHPRR